MATGTFEFGLSMGAERVLLFPITWKALSTFARGGPDLELHGNLPVVTATGQSESRFAASVPCGRAADQWEMVVPRMVRPRSIKLIQSVRPETTEEPRHKGRGSVVARSQNALPEPPAVAKPRTIRARQIFRPEPPARENFKPVVAAAPVPRVDTVDKTILRWATVIATVAVGIGVWTWITLPPATQALAPTSTASWIAQRAALNSQDQRRLLIYRGAQRTSDFRAEFDWRPDSKPAGFLFRCTDRANYQALRIGIAGWDPPRLYEEHFAVLGGKESVRTRKLVPWTPRSGPIHFALDGASFAFTLYVEGGRFDYWTDDRLLSGDIGFFTTRQQQPSIEAIRFSFSDHALPEYAGDFPRAIRTTAD